MSHLCQELDRYLTIRRSLGYDLGTAERMLKRFIAFAETEGTEHVSADLFLRWQMAFGNANRQTWTARFGVVRRFAEWLHGLDPSHEIIPHGLIPSRAGRSRPYIYRDAEIARIINAAAELPSTYGLRGSTMSTLFGLIAVTGLRINEALALNTDAIRWRRQATVSQPGDYKTLAAMLAEDLLDGKPRQPSRHPRRRRQSRS
jgi:integrase/recombinase XerD